MKLRILLFVIFLTIASNAHAAKNIYVRADGGVSGTCDGLADLPAAGHVGTACAFSNPEYATGWYKYVSSSSGGQAGNLATGDTLVIKSGSYRLGYDPTFLCDSNAAYDCATRPIPSGVTIIGCSLTGCSSQGARPELWGAGRTLYLLKLATSSVNTTIRDINFTDHGACGWNSPNHYCGSGPNDLIAFDGIDVSNSTGTQLINVWVHDIWRYGILFGNVADFTIKGDSIGASVIEYNGAAGMNGDTCGNGTTCGVASGKFVKFLGNNPDQLMSISWNGCINAYPSTGTPIECNGQYGDGFGTAETSGTWTVNYLKMIHNTSDGLDLKYCVKSGCSSTVTNSFFSGNAGNAFKIAGTAVAYNNVIEGDCDFFDNKSYTVGAIGCRAGGDTVLFGLSSGATAKFYGNTVTKLHGNVVFTITGTHGPSGVNNTCTSANTVDIQNNVFVGDGGGYYGGDAWMYKTGPTDPDPPCTASVSSQTNNIIYNIRDGNPSGSGNIYTNPSLSGSLVSNATTISTGAVYLSASNNNANESVSNQTQNDYNGFDRGASWDDGALERSSVYSGATSTCGNNTREPGETCDGTDLVDINNVTQTCITQGYTSGTLTCNSTCSGYVTTSCASSNCGNAAIDAGEQCDGALLNNQTCQSQGNFSSGNLTCTACAFNTSACVAAACGDGILNSGEQCDDGNTTNGSTCSVSGCSAICENENCPYQLLLNYTKSDAPGYQNLHTQYVDYTGLTRNADSYLRYDFGAAYFAGDFIHDFTMRIDSCTDNGVVGAIIGGWGMSATARTSIKDMTNNVDGAALYLYCLSHSSAYQWSLIGNGSATAQTFNDSIPTITRYVRVQRSGGTLTAKLYSDANRTAQVGLTLSIADANSYRYFYPIITYNSAHTGTSISGRNSNYNITAGSGGGQGTTPVTYGTKLNGCTCVGAKVQ